MEEIKILALPRREEIKVLAEYALPKREEFPGLGAASVKCALLQCTPDRNLDCGDLKISKTDSRECAMIRDGDEILFFELEDFFIPFEELKVTMINIDSSLRWETTVEPATKWFRGGRSGFIWQMQCPLKMKLENMRVFLKAKVFKDGVSGKESESETVARQILKSGNDQNQYDLLREDMENLLSSGKHSDVSFIVQGEEVKAHRNILSARSEYFDRLFSSGMIECQSGEINVTDFDAEFLRRALRHVYVGWQPMGLELEEALNLLYFADKYGLSQLFEEVLFFAKQLVGEENLKEVVRAASEIGNEDLRDACFGVLESMSEEDRGKVMIDMKKDEILGEALSNLESRLETQYA